MIDSAVVSTPGAETLASADGFAAELAPLLATALRLARAAGCAPEEAADAVQEAATSAWRHRRQCRGAFAPWFLSIVHRRALSHGRRWLTLPAFWAPHPAQLWPVDDRLDPELVTGLRRLPERQRTALWLRYGLDMSTADVAAVLGTSETAAKQLLLRAREALRRQLSERTPQ